MCLFFYGIISISAQEIEYSNTYQGGSFRFLLNFVQILVVKNAFITWNSASNHAIWVEGYMNSMSAFFISYFITCRHLIK